jgi:prepilin-type processing-associated H-X9-DG protein
VNAIDSDVKTISWVVQLAPDLEQKEVYDGWRQWQRDSGLPPPTPAMPIVECPSDATVREGAGTSMVANAGIADTHYKLNRPENGVFLDRSDPANSPANNQDFISQNDGASSTLMFSENFLATTWDARGTVEQPDKISNVFVWHDRSNPTPEMLINGGLKNQVVLTSQTARPSSFHSGGVNVAFCDGHVQFLRDDITYPVYVQLMTPLGKHCDFTEGVLMPLAATDYE